MMSIKNIKIIAVIFVGIIIILFVFSFFPKSSDYALIKSPSIKRVLNIESNNKIFYLSNDQIKSGLIKNNTINGDIVDSKISSISSSADNTKSFYAIDNNGSLKSFIINFSQNEKKEYPISDGFFWDSNEPRFITANNSKQNILDSDSKLLYSNLNYQSYVAFSGIIMGQKNNGLSESASNIYEVINNKSSQFKTLDATDIRPETTVWSNGKYLMYTNSSNKLIYINTSGSKNTLDFDISERQITQSNSDQEYFLVFDNENAKINSINFSNNKVKQIKKINLNDLKSKYGVDLRQVEQVYYFNKYLYIVASEQLVKVGV
jgi:hypothetical protein